MTDWYKKYAKQVTNQALQAKRDDNSPKKLGIDGGLFVSLARQQIEAEDPKWALTAGVPPILSEFITEFLDKISKLGLSPVFVFDGMSTAKQAPDKEKSSAKIKGGEDLSNFSYNYFDDDLIRWIVRKLLSLKIEVFTAPYWAWAQLASFMSRDNKYIAEVFGAPELIMFEFVDRVIVELAVTSCKTISKETLEQQLGSGDKVMRFVLNNSTHQYFQINGRDEETLMKQFSPIIINCPVMTAKAECKPLQTLGDNPGNVPANLREFFFCNLSSERAIMYFLMFSNILSPYVMSILATTKILDTAPLIDTDQFRQTLETIIPLRAQIIYQLVQDLDFMARREFGLLWMRTFIPQRVTPILKPPDIKLDDWEITRFGKSVPNPPTLANVLVYEAGATQQPQFCNNFNESLVAIYLKSLDLLGYFTHAAHSANSNEVSSVSIYGAALKNAEEFPEAGVLLIELLRTRALHQHAFSVPPAENGGNRFSLQLEDTELKYVVCARIMSLFPLVVSSIWGENLDGAMPSQSLVAFSAIVRQFQRSLRSLTEVIAAKLFVKSCLNFPADALPRLATELPFHTPASCHAGLLLLYMLKNPEFRATPPGKRLGKLKTEFDGVINDIEEQLDSMRKFWLCAGSIITALEGDAVDAHLVGLFKAGNRDVIDCFASLGRR